MDVGKGDVVLGDKRESPLSTIALECPYLTWSHANTSVCVKKACPASLLPSFFLRLQVVLL